jgi:hypothetical protein
VTVIAKDFDATEIAAGLDSQGFVCLRDAVAPEWIDRARAHVEMLAAERTGRYFALNWPGRDEGSPWHEMTSDPEMKRLLAELAKLGCPRAKVDDEIYNVLRVVTGASGDSKSLCYHYDNTVITALAPVLIPEGPERKAGELLVYANRRPYRSSVVTNMAEKALVQSDWYRKRFTQALPDGRFDKIKLLEPGNLYLFWGYRSYHANFPVEHDLLRATFLMHQGDPHGGSLALAAIKQLNLRRERRMREKAEAGGAAIGQ